MKMDVGCGRLFGTIALGLLAVPALAQTATVSAADYARAERLVGYHANHFCRRVVLPLPQQCRASNRILSRPQPIGKALADDHTPWFADLVVLVEGAAFQDRNAQSAEVVAAHNAPAGPGETAAAIAIRPFCRNNAHARVPADNWP